MSSGLLGDIEDELLDVLQCIRGYDTWEMVRLRGFVFMTDQSSAVKALRAL